MNKMQEQVQEFHNKHKIKDQPLLNRIRLIIEEVAEFCDACCIEEDLERKIKQIDALCDILYVTFGTADTLGIDIEPFFDEVHRSNMTKEGSKDNKITKGLFYKAPNIKRILKGQ